MHWTKQVIALKAQQRTLQIFDLAQKVKLKSASMSEDVVYWKWFSSESLGLVTDSGVYHWNVFNMSEPAPLKVFDRNSNLVVCGLDAVGRRTSNSFIFRATKSSTTA